MQTTALEYLRGLANAYAATETVTIPVATLRDALAEKQALPSTGEMRHLAERIADCVLVGSAPSIPAWIPIILAILNDAPEIIALQQAKKDVIRLDEENLTLYDNCIRIQNEAREAKAQAEHFKAALEALTNPPPRQPARDNFCPHGIRLDFTCIACDHERGIHHHIGQKQSYDSCTHGHSNPVTVCPTCEPERYQRAMERVIVALDKLGDA